MTEGEACLQLGEEEGRLLIAIQDETYGDTDDEVWSRECEQYRQGLEREFGTDFALGNIGAGADVPAFITFLGMASVPNGLLLLAAFFLGKPINENLSAWHEMGKKVRAFFTMPVYLNRQGAAVLAIESIAKELGATLHSLRLLSYRALHVLDAGDLGRMTRSDEIADAPEIIWLSEVRHVFEVEADGAVFRVGVHGRNVEAHRL